ncbi:RNA polymerase sigma factor for flagellar operon FliA [Rheinheimera pacifica]|uniref:RNA polymerase sigma factor FliA n=2 Tax=Rheinheimera pacifica TaxID=173990 RepID=A0A1H6MJU7_9GAMM|nr:RNA polymerase sigma factor FliA [Rheinheimera pacifica]MDR6983964.1 RNA polymerase sigma factor for flagellar operon FliA [Rheinheimera pacifica]PKM17342.1 MAG: RNA polymerase sigma factor FliA [Gammaproteobacteria bacterium HGW-Gammaproteobacteria-15]SEH99473.1 RNA polymerase sigma factor for flagellar operon FliA [Rheinheimera pacifica]
MNSKLAAYGGVDHMQQLVERHAPLVKRIAYHLLARLPASVLVDDLIQSGMIGLIEAAKNFDGSKGASFETFAGIRIRGAMLDEMRRGDWTPRSVHRNARLIAETIAELESQHGRDIKDIEVAEKLDISLDEYHHMLSDISSGRIIGIEDLGISEDVLVTSGDTEGDHLYESQANESFHQDLVKTISNLPEREALVLSLYYNDELNLKEIGAVLNVSESRVSQIHSQALVRLKARMQDWL